jgi:hypothetical protein
VQPQKKLWVEQLLQQREGYFFVIWLRKEKLYFKKHLFASLGGLFPTNISLCAAAYTTFVTMQNSKAGYFIEVAIHASFWAGVYYVLSGLIAASFTATAYNNGRLAEGVDARMLFPYPWVALLALMVMFYGSVFLLFKNIIRSKRKLGYIAAVVGWFLLLFAANYFVIRSMTAPTGGDRTVIITGQARTQPKGAFSLKQDTITGAAHHSPVQLPPAAPPPPPEMKFATSDWWKMQPVMLIIFLAVLGTAAAYFFIKEWVRNNLARSHAEALQYSTELRFLRSQVNPHFLFNTLNNLFSMAQKKGDDEVADGISKLSGMMRYMIYESNTDNVPLQKEIEYLQDCIALNKLRYEGNEVSVSFSCPPQQQIAGLQLAPMLFIPFVENAFKHGVVIGQNSAISIGMAVNQKILTFTCVNTDHHNIKKMDGEQTGIGLENVRRRLQLVYPGKHTVQAGSVDGKFDVHLQIDLA